MKLHYIGVDLENKENASVFMGVNLERDEETVFLDIK